MELVTKGIEQQLRQNSRDRRRDGSVKPPLKLFDPCGAATWLITEMEDDGDTLFGLCDLGQGTPELGTVSLAELKSHTSWVGLGIERDRNFEPAKTLAEYADDARERGAIAA